MRKFQSYVAATLIAMFIVFSLLKQDFNNTIPVILCLITIQFFMLRKYGPFSSASILLIFYSYPLFAPFFTRYVMGAQYIKFGNQSIQTNFDLLFTVQLYFLISIIVATITTYVLNDRRARHNNGGDISYSDGSIPSGKRTSIIFCFLFMIMAYITEPSFGTILTQSYSDVTSARFAGTEFAGGLFIVFWIFAFINYQKGYSKTLFIVLTIVATLWLALHAKRAPVLGLSFVLVIYLHSIGAVKIKYVSMVLGLVVLLFLVGEIRNSFYLGDGVDLQVSRFTDYDVASLPGNGAGIFMSFLGSVYITDNIQVGLLWGQSYLDQAIGIIPGFIWNIFDYTVPESYGRGVFSQHLYYNGGMHVLGPVYGNFALPGILIFSVILGYLIYFIGKSHNSARVDTRAYAYLLTMFFPSAMWYNSMVLVSWLVYFTVLIMIFRVLPRQ